MTCCREAVENLCFLLQPAHNKGKITISSSAEVRRQSPLCDASVGLCVVLVGFVMFTVMCLFPSDAASRRALQLALQQLAESQPDATAKNLLQSLQSSGIGGKAGAPRCGISCSVGKLVWVAGSCSCVQNDSAAAACQKGWEHLETKLLVTVQMFLSYPSHVFWESTRTFLVSLLVVWGWVNSFAFVNLQVWRDEEKTLLSRNNLQNDWERDFLNHCVFGLWNSRPYYRQGDNETWSWAEEHMALLLRNSSGS